MEQTQTYTLNQLHKLYQKLCRTVETKSLRKMYGNNDDEAYVKIPIHKMPSVDAIQDAVQRAKLKENIANTIELDRLTLKQLLFKANAVSGISERLTLIDFNQKKLGNVQGILRSLEEISNIPVFEPDDDDKVRVELYDIATERQLTYIYAQTYTTSELKDEQRSILAKIASWESEIEELNAVTKVSVCLSEHTKLALGLQ